MSTWDQVKETTKGLVKMIPDPIPDNGRIIIGEYKISTDVTSIRIKKEIESIIVFYAGTWKEIRYLHALAIWEDGVRKSITPKRISFCNQRYGIYPGMETNWILNNLSGVRIDLSGSTFVWYQVPDWEREVHGEEALTNIMPESLDPSQDLTILELEIPWVIAFEEYSQEIFRKSMIQELWNHLRS